MTPSDPISNRRSSVAFKATLGVVLAIGALVVVAIAVSSGEFVREQRIAARVRTLGGEVDIFEHDWNPLWNRIHHIKLSGSGVTDDDLKLIGSATELDEVELADTAITDQGVAYLADAASLSQGGSLIGQFIDLSGTRITDAALVTIPRIPVFTRLRLSRTQITSQGLAALANSQIDTLEFDGDNISAEQLAEIGKLPNIIALSLAETKIEESGLTHLKHIQRLNLAGSNITAAGIEQLVASAPQLNHLIAPRTGLGNRALAALAYASALHTLDLSQTELSEEGLEHLQKIPNLTCLLLTGCSITDDGVDALAKITSLESLDLRATSVTDLTLTKLGKFPKLAYIFLGSTQVSLPAATRLNSASRQFRMHTDDSPMGIPW